MLSLSAKCARSSCIATKVWSSTVCINNMFIRYFFLISINCVCLSYHGNVKSNLCYLNENLQIKYVLSKQSNTISYLDNN
jgi:hypothetical protein